MSHHSASRVSRSRPFHGSVALPTTMTFASDVATTKDVLVELRARCERVREDGSGRLPSERALARELKASRSTVRRALNTLAEEGIITIVRGRNGGAHIDGAEGAVTATPDEHLFAIWSTDGSKVNRSLSAVAGIPMRLAEQGLDVGIRVVSLALEVPEPQVAAQLDINPAAPVVSLLRVRFANGAPLSVERMYLSFERFPHLVEEGLGGATSMYVLLQERYGVAVASVDEEIEVAAASPQSALLLAIEPGDAVLVLRRRACDAEGRPVECSFDLFRGDRTRLTLRTLDTSSQLSSARSGVRMRAELRGAT